ncbi:uncharacterized protein SRS1_14453 [Sporisorium reilianum f. sp. reilianum]|uniref:Uncharacterized protein n=1 Tax=Sporisorium reilianum f. sp. reilianum TaxID=72559 RepID=A0A2N8UGZ9_9BASI|nr:uncharacterized protein SRS1_14453 [Sporisorium reilianum f. sp. reilianum]
MDLSNLRTSLREEEVSGQRRTAHLRAAEDELNAFFRSSALGLTTLYRQGVAATKASYEKGYAHALAHVLELWEKDRDWLKGYLQRRIEAIEAADAEDDADEVPMDQQPQPQPQPQPQQPGLARSNNTIAATTRPAQQAATDSPKQTNKRSRNAFSDAASASSSHRDIHDSPAERRAFHRMAPQSVAAASRFPSHSSAPNFASSSFNFSAPLAYPSSSSVAANASASTSSPNKTRTTRSTDAPLIKTSNPATSRRRLHKLKGLRAGRDRIVEIDAADEDEILPDGGAAGAAADDADAWTDDEDAAAAAAAGGYDENASPVKGAKPASGRGKKVVVWAERAAAGSTTHSAHAPQVAEGKVLERLDRRKRRRSTRPDDAIMADEDGSSAEVSREDEGQMYRYHS